MSDLIIVKVKEGINIQADMMRYWRNNIIMQKETGVILLPWFLTAIAVPEDTELKIESEGQETVTEFADRCRECGAKYGKLLKQKQSGNFTVLEDIKAEIKEWYWQADKQAIAKDPCVVDAMIDLFIRTIEKKESEGKEKK